MVNTTHGEMDEAELIRVDGVYEDDHERTTWVEYWKSTTASCMVEGHDITARLSRDGSEPATAERRGDTTMTLPSGTAPGNIIAERVHRSAHVTIKEGLEMLPAQGGVN